MIYVFFFKQKTAYEWRISDWSSDVCSSDLLRAEGEKQSKILEAEGRREAVFRDSEARERSAEAEEQATKVVSDAIAGGGVQAINYFVEIGRASCRERVCQYV